MLSLRLLFVMYKYKVLAGVLSLILLVSCGIKKSNFVEIEAKRGTDSVVYVYRPYSISNILLSPDVMVDGEKIFELQSNSYFGVSLSKGDHIIKLGLSERYAGVHQMSIKTKQDKTVYLRVTSALEFQKNKPYNRSFNLEEVSEAVALSEIQKTKNINKITKDKVVTENKIESESEVEEESFTISKSRNPFNK